MISSFLKLRAQLVEMRVHPMQLFCSGVLLGTTERIVILMLAQRTQQSSGAFAYEELPICVYCYFTSWLHVLGAGIQGCFKHTGVACSESSYIVTNC